MRHGRCLIAWCLLVSAYLVPLQAQDAPSLVFEVATVKPTVPHGDSGLRVYPGGRLVIPRAPLKSLVATAFGLPPWQVEGGDLPGNFAVEAKASDEMASSITNLNFTWETIGDERLRAMLQALLIERFRLQLHRETKPGTVYMLERTDSTLRLRPSTPPPSADKPPSLFGNSGSMGYAGGRWTISRMSMAQVATFASTYVLHAPVLDRTGLEGQFDYRQSQPDADPVYAGDQAPSFLRTVSEVGLRLRRTEGPVEMLVIDAAEAPVEK